MSDKAWSLCYFSLLKSRLGCMRDSSPAKGTDLLPGYIAEMPDLKTDRYVDRVIRLGGSPP